MANRIQERLRFQKGIYGSNWRKLRESTDYSLRDFAEKVQISYPSISKIENELVYPTIEQINIYQDYFNVSLDYLVGLTENNSVEINKITLFTGLSQETIEKLHMLTEKANHLSDFSPDERLELLVSDYSFKTDWRIAFYNDLICSSSIDKAIEALRKYRSTTSILEEQILSIASIDDITNGYIRGLIIKASLIEKELSDCLSEFLSEYDHRKSDEYKEKWTTIISDLKNKTGIADNADVEEITFANNHLQGLMNEHEYNMPSAKNTMEALMMIDVNLEEE